VSNAVAGMSENEQKQQLSVAYVHAVAARAGYACEVNRVDDDSVDLMVAARGMVHSQSILRSPRLELQLKATSQSLLRDEHLAFPLPMKNYDDLRCETLIPRLLVVLLLPEDPNGWLEQTEDQMISRRCAYWTSLLGKPESANETTVTVHLPRDQPFTVEILRRMMEQVSRRELL
jgi:Domain of unknown function (DUF4365)